MKLEILSLLVEMEKKVMRTDTVTKLAHWQLCNSLIHII